MTRTDVATPVAPTPGAPVRRRHRTPLVAAGLALAAAAGAMVVALGAADHPGAVAADPGQVSFEVFDTRGDTVLYARQMPVGTSFTLTHVHSVTGRPVVETFSILEGPTVALEELWFDEPGPNLPAGPERIGDHVTTFLHENGAFRVLHHSHVIGSVPLLVGSDTVDHAVGFEDGEQVRLLDVAERGAHVELRVSAPAARGR